MYQIDDKDRVGELLDVPQSSVGAPNPFVLSDEGKVVLAFYWQNTPEDWDGTTVKVTSYESEGPLAIATFKWCYAYMFGPPNDEAFSGHPLAERGLDRTEPMKFLIHHKFVDLSE